MIFNSRIFHDDAANHVADAFGVVECLFHVFQNIFPFNQMNDRATGSVFAGSLRRLVEENSKNFLRGGSFLRLSV